MTIEIKTDREEFNLAISNGAVYGKVIRRAVIYVYVELGVELQYQTRPKDDANAEYKKFFGCTVYYADNDENLDTGEYLTITRDCVVVIYC